MAESIKDLKFDERNFNKHTDRGMELLEKSIKENKFGRSVLVDKDGNIIAGNATVETARKLGKDKIKIIETTGDELVVVKRTDLEIDSKEARELALADNGVAAVNLEWDEDAIQTAVEQFGIVPEDWGGDLEAMKQWDEMPAVEGDPDAPTVSNPFVIKVKVDKEEKDNLATITELIKQAVAEYNCEVE